MLENVILPTATEDGSYTAVYRCVDCGAETDRVENIVIPRLIGSKGDPNGDGKINVKDITCIQRHIAEYELLTGDALTAADINGDGVVTIEDATLLQMILAEFDVI